MSKFFQVFFGGLFYYTSRQYHIWLFSAIFIWCPLVFLMMTCSLLWDFTNEIFESVSRVFLQIRNEISDLEVKGLFTRKAFQEISDEMDRDWHNL